MAVSKYYKNWVKRRKADGWKQVNWLLPPEIIHKLQQYRDTLWFQFKLDEARQKQKE